MVQGCDIERCPVKGTINIYRDAPIEGKYQVENHKKIIHNKTTEKGRPKQREMKGEIDTLWKI